MSHVAKSLVDTEENPREGTVVLLDVEKEGQANKLKTTVAKVLGVLVVTVLVLVLAFILNLEEGGKQEQQPCSPSCQIGEPCSTDGDCVDDLVCGSNGSCEIYCSAFNFESLESQLQNCKAGKIEILSNISIEANVIIPKGVEIDLFSQNRTTIVGLGEFPLFAVFGSLTLSNINVFGNVVVDGEDAWFEVGDGTMESAQVPLVSMHNGSLFTAFAFEFQRHSNGSVVTSCPTCVVQLVSGNIFQQDTTIIATDAMLVKTSDVHVFVNNSNMSGLVDVVNQPNLVLLDAKKVYLPYLLCQETTTLDLYVNTSGTLSSCMSLCDVNDRCNGVVWNYDEDVQEASCELFSHLNDCSPIDYNHMYQDDLDIYQVVSKSMPYVSIDPLEWCVDGQHSRHMEVNSSQYCRSLCNLDKDCIAIEFDENARLCSIVKMVHWCTGSETTQSSTLVFDLKDDVPMEFIDVAFGCEVVQSHLLSSIQSSSHGCEMLCIVHPNCDAVIQNETSCQLVNLNNQDRDYVTNHCGDSKLSSVMKMSVRSLSLHFPKPEFQHFESNQLCFRTVENIASHMDVDVKECEEECMLTANCVAYEFITPENTCFLKSKAGLEYCITEQKTLGIPIHELDFEETFQVLERMDHGVSLMNMTFLSCQARCWFDPACDNFLYNPIQSQCVLETFGESYIDIVDVNNTFHFQLIDSTFNASVRTDMNVYGFELFPFGDVVEVPASSEVDCNLLCGLNGACRMWVFGTNKCLFYQDGNLLSGATGKMIQMNTGDWKIGYPGRAIREYTMTTNHSCMPLNEMYVIETDDMDDCIVLCELLKDCATVLRQNLTCTFYAMYVDKCDGPNATATAVVGDLYVAYSNFEFEVVPSQFCANGKDIISFPNINLEKCKEQCFHWNENLCRSFTYDWHTGLCKLYRGSSVTSCTPPPSNIVTFISIEKYLDGDVGFLQIDDACPESDFVLETFLDGTFDRCKRKCEMNDDCLAIVYDEDQRICQLKDGQRYRHCGQSTNSSYAVKYVPNRFVPEGAFCGPTSGIDLYNFTLPTCASLCENWDKCTSFTYQSSLERCKLHETDDKSTDFANCDPTEYFVPQNNLLFTKDDHQTCGVNYLEQPFTSLSFDECMALCNANVKCMGINYDARFTNCVLLKDTARSTCAAIGTQCTSCNEVGSLFVSFGYTAKVELGYEYIIGADNCHRTNGTTRLPFGFEASLERCQRMCSTDDECETVSVENGVCVFGGTDGGATFSCHDGIMKKLPLNRYTRLLNVQTNEQFPLHYPTKTIPECQSLCRSKSDCIDVFVNSNVSLYDGCSLSSNRNYTQQGVEDGGYDVYIEQNRFANDFLDPYEDMTIFKGRNIVVQGSYGVLTLEDCGFLCYKREENCGGFEFGTDSQKMVLSKDGRFNCILYTHNHGPELYDFLHINLFQNLREDELQFFGYHESNSGYVAGSWESLASCHHSCAVLNDDRYRRFSYDIYGYPKCKCYGGGINGAQVTTETHEIYWTVCGVDTCPSGAETLSEAIDCSPTMWGGPGRQIQCKRERAKVYGIAFFGADSSDTSRFYIPKTVPTESLWPGNELDARLWVRQPNGRAGRALIKSVTLLGRKITGLVAAIEVTMVAAGSIAMLTGPLAETLDQIDDVSDAASVTSAGIEKGVKLGGKFLSKVKGIGQVLSLVAQFCGSIFKSGKGLLQGLSRKSKLARKITDKLDNIILKFTGLLAVFEGLLSPIPPMMLKFATLLVTAHQCSYEVGNMDAVYDLEATIDKATEMSDEMLQSMEQIDQLRILDPFGDARKKMMQVLASLHGVIGGFSGLHGIFSMFGWLADIAGFSLCIKRIGCFTLETIADILSPLGFLLKLLTDPIISFIEGLFPEIVLPIPNFDIGIFTFMEGLTLDLDIAYNETLIAMQKPFQELTNITQSLQELMPKNPTSCSKLEKMIADGEEEVVDDEDELEPVADFISSKRLGRRVLAPSSEDDVIRNYQFLAELPFWRKLLSFPVKIAKNQIKQKDKEIFVLGEYDDDKRSNERRNLKKSSSASVLKEEYIAFTAVTLIAMKSDNYHTFTYDSENEDYELVSMNDVVPFRVALDGFVGPSQVGVSKRTQKLFVSFQLKGTGGSTEGWLGPICWMQVKNGEFEPFDKKTFLNEPTMDPMDSDIRKAYKKYLDVKLRYSHGSYIDFGAPGNPWKDSEWEVEVEAKLYEMENFSKDVGGQPFFKKECNGCPVGSMCTKPRRGRVLGPQSTKRKALTKVKTGSPAKKQNNSGQSVVTTAFPIKKYCELYFDKRTFGACNLAGLPHVTPGTSGIGPEYKHLKEIAAQLDLANTHGIDKLTENGYQILDEHRRNVFKLCQVQGTGESTVPYRVMTNTFNDRSVNRQNPDCKHYRWMTFTKYESENTAEPVYNLCTVKQQSPQMCSVLQCNSDRSQPHDGEYKGRGSNKYHAEHMYPKHGKENDRHQRYNFGAKGNFVMAWGVWNIDVETWRKNDNWGAYFKEKEDVYSCDGTNYFKKVTALLDWCNNGDSGPTVKTWKNDENKNNNWETTIDWKTVTIEQFVPDLDWCKRV